MNLSILKKMLPGLLPLFVFILADEIWGTKIGLIVALVFGIVELAFVWFKEKRFDKFILLDTGLLVFLGLISILLDNDIFFKLKPGLIQIIFLAIIGLSAFSKHNILLVMTKRYMKDMHITDAHIDKMRQTMKILFWIILAHTLLVFYSAIYMTKEAWVFISGGLFYIIFGLYFVVEIVKNKIKMNRLQNEEWLPLVDEEGNITGKATRSQCHKDTALLHPVVHLHVFNSKGELFLQKRPDWKDIQAGKWDTAVGGHISIGESLEDALKRETIEEIGINDYQPYFLKKYVWKTDVESELIHIFITKYDQTITVNKEELDEGRFWSYTEIKKHIKNETFTPNLINEIKILVEMKLLK